MNKKLVVKNALDKIVYCVLSSDRDYEEQLSEVLGIHPGHGFSVSFDGSSVTIFDYFHGEKRAEFDVISFKKCKEEVCLNWKEEK